MRLIDADVLIDRILNPYKQAQIGMTDFLHG